jgi:hypothetical protein
MIAEVRRKKLEVRRKTIMNNGFEPSKLNPNHSSIKMPW